MLRPVLLNQRIPLRRWLYTLQLTVHKTMTWLLQTVALTKGILKKLDVSMLTVFSWMVRCARSSGETWVEFYVCRRCLARQLWMGFSERTWSMTWRRMQWSWAGHLARLDGFHRLTKWCTECMSLLWWRTCQALGVRKPTRGGPRLNWEARLERSMSWLTVDDFFEEFVRVSWPLASWREIAKHREIWKHLGSRTMHLH